MKVFSWNQSYPLRQQIYFDRKSAFVLFPVTHLTIQITAKSIHVAIGREDDGVRVSSTRMAHNNAEKSGHKSRLTYGLGIIMTKLPMYTPTPGEKTAVSGQCYGMMLTCHCFDNDFLREKCYQLGIWAFT